MRREGEKSVRLQKKPAAFGPGSESATLAILSQMDIAQLVKHDFGLSTQFLGKKRKGGVSILFLGAERLSSVCFHKLNPHGFAQRRGTRDTLDKRTSS